MDDAANQKFDQLARSLATGVSRRGALKMGAGVVGALAAAAAVPMSTWADPGAGGGNSECAHACNAIFPPGPLRGMCKSAGAMDLGVGVCHSLCPNGGATCQTLQTGCGGAGSPCVCFATVEAFGFCHLPQACAGLSTCSSTADCLFGEACVNVTCCGNISVCIRPCLTSIGGAITPLAIPSGLSMTTGVAA